MFSCGKQNIGSPKKLTTSALLMPQSLTHLPPSHWTTLRSNTSLPPNTTQPHPKPTRRKSSWFITPTRTIRRLYKNITQKPTQPLQKCYMTSHSSFISTWLSQHGCRLKHIQSHCSHQRKPLGETSTVPWHPTTQCTMWPMHTTLVAT